MWLLGIFPFVARVVAWVYYRVDYVGPSVPHSGPLLLVANHPNSLLDPTLVVAAAERPVRFLAKAPLFDDPRIGWLVKAGGAIPVYRRQDDASQMARNTDTFRAAYAALAAGAAVGIFPEGISHNEPGLTQLKTGAARIALGSMDVVGAAVPIVPIGIVLREKDVFRSAALVVRGDAVDWSELAGRPDAVRELTERIDAGLRAVTVNLQAWDDAPVVEAAVRVWEAGQGVSASPAERVARANATQRILAAIRAASDAAGLELVEEVRVHHRRLQRLGLRPADLHADVGLSRGVAWAAHRVHLLAPVELVVAALGAALFWVPYRVTGMIVDRVRIGVDERSTWKVLVGFVLYLVWLVGVAGAVGYAWGWRPALGVLIGMPIIGMAGVLARQRWTSMWNDARRFLLLRSRRELVALLRQRQLEIEAKLERTYRLYRSTHPPA